MLPKPRVWVSALLAACGGGSGGTQSDAPGPVIDDATSDATTDAVFDADAMLVVEPYACTKTNRGRKRWPRKQGQVSDEAQVGSVDLALAEHDAPVSIHAFEYIALWHERFEAEPAHTWLRSILAAAAQLHAPDARDRDWRDLWGHTGSRRRRRIQRGVRGSVI